jgi:tetratricopeptide (TPR) repeat protein
MFAAWGHASVTSRAFQMIGASGAIAAVTTAYLALFPRSHVTVLVWLFLFIHFFEVPAMIFIGLKILVDMIAPGLGRSAGVAHATHLAGYLFGFVAALTMLAVRALPRDQFDILALWKRWHQRRGLAAAMADPATAARAQYGTVARTVPADAEQRAEEDRRFNEIADLRSRISEQLERRDKEAAAALYEELSTISPKHCLSERQQLEIAREFYRTGRFSQAAAAFDRFVEHYPYSTEAGDVRLLLGIICARDLHQYEDADKHLTRSMETLRDRSRRDQCIEWLKTVRAALGRPAPDV